MPSLSSTGSTSWPATSASSADRLGRPRTQILLGQVPEQPERVADQRVDQRGAGLASFQAIAGLPGSS